MKLDKAAVARIKNATPKKQQKGASSLEYIMLAAVIIALVTFVFNTDVGETLRKYVSDLFTSVTISGSGGSGATDG